MQDMKEFNPIAAPDVAVCEFFTDSGPVDYLLFIDRKKCLCRCKLSVLLSMPNYTYDFTIIASSNL